MSRRRHGIGRDLAKGAIAGAVATWVMGRVTTYLYEHEDPEARREENRARKGRTAYETAAEKAGRRVGTRLTPTERHQAGLAIHWGTGIAAGAAYAVLRRRIPAGLGSGAAFGTAFWAVVDEGLVPLLGLTPGPGAFPWQTHARGLAGHLSFGTVVDGTLRLLDRVA